MVCSSLYVTFLLLISVAKQFFLVEVISPISIGISMGLMELNLSMCRSEYTLVVVHLNQASGSQERP